MAPQSGALKPSLILRGQLYNLGPAFPQPDWQTFFPTCNPGWLAYPYIKIFLIFICSIFTAPIASLSISLLITIPPGRTHLSPF